MKKLFLPLAAALFAAGTLNAQYTAIPSQCGITQPTLSCIVDLTPETSGGIYPTMRLYQINYRTTAQYQGYLEFSTVLGPEGYLGSAQVYASQPTATGVQLWFIGSYAPASGGGTYTGTAILTLTYKRQWISGRWVYTTAVQSGPVNIN